MSGSSTNYLANLRSAVTDFTPLPDDIVQSLKQSVTDSTFRSTGRGPYGSTFQSITSQFDRFGTKPFIPNHELAGLTFITSPKLNLSTSSLRQDRVMSMLDILDVDSFPFSIRCYLDTKFARRQDIRRIATSSHLYNSDTPFIIPLSNCLQTMTGFPSFEVDTETSEGGFFGEDQTIARGSDMNMRTTTLNLTFRDFQGGYITALLYFWIRYIALVTRGYTTAYMEDILDGRINYTCSIYRFTLDPYRRRISKWMKATGCFPTALTLGDAFDIPSEEHYIKATQEITVPFVCNNIDYMDPIVLKEFNILTERFCPKTGNGYIPDTINGEKNTKKVALAPWSDRVPATIESGSNFTGLPYIDTVTGNKEMLFMARPEELENPAQVALQQLTQQVNQLIASKTVSSTIQSATDYTSLTSTPTTLSF